MTSKALEKVQESHATKSRKPAKRTNQSNEWRYIGQSDVVHFGGLEWRRDENRDISDLDPSFRLQLAGNPFFVQASEKTLSGDIEYAEPKPISTRKSPGEKLAEGMHLI